MKQIETTHYIHKNLEEHLEIILPNHDISNVYKYPCLPPGKVFRPLLVAAIYEDFENKEYISQNKLLSAHNLLASSIEIHHAYTLVHDDLPCMDDDDFRRGRASTHKKFNEWKALLAGDTLLIGSFRLLSMINHQQAQNLFKIFSHMTGGKGLIHGQVIDLSLEMNESLEKLLLTHELKTARLIQLSILGSYLLTKNPNFKTAKKLIRLGKKIGISFQLIDDLTELVEKELTKHETDVNPWPKDFNLVSNILKNYLDDIKTHIDELKLTSLKVVLGAYFKKQYNTLKDGEENIKKHLKDIQSDKGLLPVMLSLQGVC